MLPAEERGGSIGTHGEDTGRHILEEPDHLLIDLRALQQVVVITDFRQAELLLGRAQPRQIVGLIGIEEAQHIFLRGFGERRLRQELRGKNAPDTFLVVQPADDQLVFAPGLLIEKVGRLKPQRVVKAMVLDVLGLVAVEVDADIQQHLHSGLVVTLGRLDIQCAAIDRQGAAVVDKLIALGVAAKVIVVIEYEHLGLGAYILDEEMSRRRPLMPPPTTIRS